MEKKTENNKKPRSFWYRLWHNYVFRNILVAAILLIILVLIISLLLNIFTRHNKSKQVPDFTNITLIEAEKLAKKDNLRIEINDSLYVPAFDPGVILEQRPSAGTAVKAGRRIYVTINSSQQKIIDVPYVAGYSLRQAKNILETAGLEIDRLIYTNDIATNNVLEQRIGNQKVTAGSDIQAQVGSGVTLVVGKAPGADRIAIPRVVGLPLRDAKSRLWDAGLNVNNVHLEDDIDQRNIRDARVYKQTPDQGGRVELGTNVSIYLSLDSTTLATGVSSSDRTGARNAARQRAIQDSLSKAGLSGERLLEEFEWIMKIENGEARPEDRPRRPVEDTILESLENYGNIMQEDTGEFFD